jgi:CDP-glucose 4,6-dehydratase
VNHQFWRGKKVFLTGHTGFKGGWLSMWLQQMGANVTGYAISPPTNPCLFEAARVGEGMHSVIADIRDFEKLSAAITACAPDIVFHLAAQPLVRRSYVDPVETFSTNVMGTVNLLEVVRKNPAVKVVVNVTTDKCYENREWHWGYRENEPLGGRDPYSNSKACSELVTAAYRESFFRRSDDKAAEVAVATARAGNVIGGGDWAENRLIPDILRAIDSGEPVRIRNPFSTRPWQHVLEPLRGYLSLAEALYSDGSTFSEAWNFGPNDDDVKSVASIAKLMVGALGGEFECTAEQSDRLHEAKYLKLDISKAKAELDWLPVWNLDIALAETIAWHKTYQSGGDMKKFTINQIIKYESRLN